MVIHHRQSSSSDPHQYNETSSAVGRLQYWEHVLTLRSQVGWVGPGFAYLSGVILAAIMLVIVICSLPCVRRSGHFEVNPICLQLSH